MVFEIKKLTSKNYSQVKKEIINIITENYSDFLTSEEITFLINQTINDYLKTDKNNFCYIISNQNKIIAIGSYYRNNIKIILSKQKNRIYYQILFDFISEQIKKNHKNIIIKTFEKNTELKDFLKKNNFHKIETKNSQNYSHSKQFYEKIF